MGMAGLIRLRSFALLRLAGARLRRVRHNVAGVAYDLTGLGLAGHGVGVDDPSLLR